MLELRLSIDEEFLLGVSKLGPQTKVSFKTQEMTDPPHCLYLHLLVLFSESFLPPYFFPQQKPVTEYGPRVSATVNTVTSVTYFMVTDMKYDGRGGPLLNVDLLSS